MPSSVIRNYRYRQDEKALEILFVSGKLYRYVNVPPQVFEEMRSSASKGEFFNQHIRDRFAFEKVASAS